MKGCQGCTQCDFGNLCHRSFFCNASSLIAQTQIPDSVLQVQNCIRVSMSTNCILCATCNCQCHKPPNPQTPTRYWHRGTKICRVIKRAATGAGDWEMGTGNLTSPGGKVEVGDGRWKVGRAKTDCSRVSHVHMDVDGEPGEGACSEVQGHIEILCCSSTILLAKLIK